MKALALAALAFLAGAFVGAVVAAAFLDVDVPAVDPVWP